jgi:pimeloyl-ACP methyl ester carboxylesterase
MHEGHRLVYDEYGAGDKTVVLLPGLLLSRRMHGPLAEQLASAGYRVLCLDVLGHGDSDRPDEMWKYSMPAFGAQAIALLDHLEIEQAVIGGTSLGANTTLEATVQAPARVRGMIVEMPVLDNALLACALAFTPLLVGLTFGAPLARGLAGLALMVPRGGSLLIDMGLDWVSQDPKPSASVLQGLFYGEVAPPRRRRLEIENKALVIGHPRDPVHPFSDADMLVRELRNGRILDANSILELRVTPERLTGEIVDFVEECWRAERPAAGSGGRARAQGNGKPGRAPQRRGSTR